MRFGNLLLGAVWDDMVGDDRIPETSAADHTKIRAGVDLILSQTLSNCSGIASQLCQLSADGRISWQS
jgi:hypothetical protein